MTLALLAPQCDQTRQAAILGSCLEEGTLFLWGFFCSSLSLESAWGLGHSQH